MDVSPCLSSLGRPGSGSSGLNHAWVVNLVNGLLLVCGLRERRLERKKRGCGRFLTFKCGVKKKTIIFYFIIHNIESRQVPEVAPHAPCRQPAMGVLRLELKHIGDQSFITC